MASPDEVRTTSSTGGQKGMKTARFDLIPIEALTELAKHYGRGAEKYDDNQWRKGYEWSKSYAALQRHLTAFWNGEDIDPDPEMQGASHLAAAAWHIFTLLTFAQDFPQFDDRYKKPEEKLVKFPFETAFSFELIQILDPYLTKFIEGPAGPQSFVMQMRPAFEARD